MLIHQQGSGHRLVFLIGIAIFISLIGMLGYLASFAPHIALTTSPISEPIHHPLPPTEPLLSMPPTLYADGSSMPNTQWEIYEDINVRYRIKYPRGWDVRKQTGINSDAVEAAESLQFTAPDGSNADFFLVPVSKNTSIPPEEYTRRLTCQFINLCADNPHYQEQPVQRMTIHGLPAVRIISVNPLTQSTSGFADTDIQTLVTGDKQMYWFHYSYISDEREKNAAMIHQIEESVQKVQIYEQVLQTLEDDPRIACLAENADTLTPYPPFPETSIPAGWKTYTDGVLPFSFSYPSNWNPEKTNQYNTAQPADTVTLNGEQGGLTIAHTRDRCNMTIEAYTRYLLCRFQFACSQGQGQETTVQYFTLNGRQAVKIVHVTPEMYSVGPDETDVGIGIRSGNTFYYLHTGYLSSDNPEVIKTFRQALQQSKENLAVFEHFVSHFSVQ